MVLHGQASAFVAKPAAQIEKKPWCCNATLSELQLLSSNSIPGMMWQLDEYYSVYTSLVKQSQ